jgi:cell division protein FtsL
MDSNYYDQTRVFKFNLVPPKTKEEIVVLEERDNSILYSFLLVFFAMFIFFILNLLQTFVINQRIDLTNSQIATQETSFSNYEEIKRINGELITKGELLEPVLKKDIKLTELLDLSAQITSDNFNTQIRTYSREATGEFVLTFSTPDVESVGSLLDYLYKKEELKDVFARSILVNSNSVDATISFSLINI